jgi:hypothetical protein
MQPKVKFENQKSARTLTDEEIEKKLAEGGVVHNTALHIREAKKFLRRKGAAKKSKVKRSAGAAPALVPSAANQASDPGLDRSDESAIAINPKNPKNIVAGAATFDGQQFTNSAYVSMDEGNTWKTITVLTDTDEGAGIAFDDSSNCYYVTMQGGFNPCCVISKDGGLTWSAPALFGSGDKTAVAARGQIALCGFDRINTEACAYTLDGGANWTVHDFTDSGLGTGPLVSYDQQYFYIIYGALDDNIKIYVSPDQGTTWSGPNIIVAGNSAFSIIAGPLSYQGDSLTCPGTNVAIDGSGTLHVLYIDSTKHLPMYTSSSDHGSTWSAPVNVNPERANDTHMFPCLSCNKDGDILGGSMVYDQTLEKYLILRHTKAHNETAWTTTETDDGPWTAAGPSPGFRIGFGDYFDCDSIPQCGINAMAWSETPDGKEPWQTWARVLDPISECSTLPEPDECCVSPCDPPWLVKEDCLVWYEDRFIRFPLRKANQREEFTNLSALREYIEFRITYQHKLCLVGKQHGPLLYTVTLLPQERVKLYHSDRYRKITSEQQRYSVQTTFTQFLSIVHEARVTNKLDVLNDMLTSSKSASSGSSGGGFFFGLFGFGGGSSDSSQSSVTDHNLVQVGSVSSDFFQSVSQSSLLTRAERSLVISTYEDKELVDVTVREIRNDNNCRAVTYFVRQVMDAYIMSTVVYGISYRIIAPGVPPLWHSIDDLGWLPAAVATEIKNLLTLLPKVGDVTDKSRPFTLPTDGAVYDAELAHCCSCEPEREALLLIEIEKAKCESRKLCIEAELLEMEVQRRKALIAKGDLDPFEPVPATTTPPSA